MRLANILYAHFFIGNWLHEANFKDELRMANEDVATRPVMFAGLCYMKRAETDAPSGIHCDAASEFAVYKL